MTQNTDAGQTTNELGEVVDLAGGTGIPAFLDRTEGTPEEVTDGEVVQTESDVGPADETAPF